MEKNVKPFKWKKWVKFRHVYALILFLITALLAWHIINLLVLTPMRETGETAHGSRMDNIDEYDEAWEEATVEFAQTLDDVDYVDIDWRRGPVIYVNVRVEPGTTRRYSRRAARAVVENFIENSNDVALQYDIQVVVSYGDIREMREEHHEALRHHVHSYNHDLVERILAWAEEYPSATNVARAESNINIFSASIVAIVEEEGLEEMRARVASLDGGVDEPFEDEDFEPMPSFEAEIRQIPQSEISRFPIWGTWSNDRERIVWSPIS